MCPNMNGKTNAQVPYRDLTPEELERLRRTADEFMDKWPELKRRALCKTFIDVEASALENGYPIEVGWAIYDPTSGDIATESHLILYPPWLEALNWEPSAQGVHGITQDELRSTGKPVEFVAERMNEAIPGTAFSDCVEFDQAWIDHVFSAAGSERKFRILDVSVPFARPPVTALGYAHAEQHVHRLAPRTHRAGDDALHWAVMYQLASS